MQQEPNVTQPPIPRGKQNRLGQIIAALVITLLVCLPLLYFVGQLNGYNSGYQAGVSKAYDEGYDDGWETGRFDFYYVETEQKSGVYELVDWVAKWEWIKPYQEGVFDCSEMSAFLEWKLENEGWHTYIVTGNSPFSSGKHAWLLVETGNGTYMPVESTSMSVVMWDDPYFDNYFTYEHRFETIQEALNHSATEFDWWKN